MMTRVVCMTQRGESYLHVLPSYVQVPHTTSSQQGRLHHNLPATRGGLGHPKAQVDLAFLGGHVCLVSLSHPWHPETFCYDQVWPVRLSMPAAGASQVGACHLTPGYILLTIILSGGHHWKGYY